MPTRSLRPLPGLWLAAWRLAGGELEGVSVVDFLLRLELVDFCFLMSLSGLTLTLHGHTHVHTCIQHKHTRHITHIMGTCMYF